MRILGLKQSLQNVHICSFWVAWTQVFIMVFSVLLFSKKIYIFKPVHSVILSYVNSSLSKTENNHMMRKNRTVTICFAKYHVPIQESTALHEVLGFSWCCSGLYVSVNMCRVKLSDSPWQIGHRAWDLTEPKGQKQRSAKVEMSHRPGRLCG